MTLVEVIVTVAIIAVISVAVTTAFLSVLKINDRSNSGVRDASAVEKSIAGVSATDSGSINSEDIEISIGGVWLPSKSDTYTEGGKSYTMLQGTNAQAPDPVNFGDGAGAIPGGIETGSAGGNTKYTVIASGSYKIEVWGAQGGGSLAGPGRGGYSAGTVNLAKGDVLYLYAGGAGDYYEEKNILLQGGYNGGGSVITGEAPGEGGTTGGGASDIRIGSDSLYSRVIVAGGGGGGGFSRKIAGYQQNPAQVPGGAGGGLTGAAAQVCTDSWKNYPRGQGGDQSAGGQLVGSTANTSSYGMLATPGIFGNGGHGTGFADGGAGGGGGWYGGGGGCINAAGGGSSWIFTQASYDAWNNSTDKPQYLLDSEYYLSDAQTIAGTASMPDPQSTTGGTMTGRAAAGFIRITYLGQ